MSGTKIDAANSGTYRLGGEVTVNRLGYGAMQITGDGVWGPPENRSDALAVLRRAVELGVNFIDTADSYGPDVSEQLIAEALHPYPDDLVIATKGGLLRTGPGGWVPCGRPDYLRQQVEMSLRYLKLERIDLYQLHRIDPEVPVADTLGALAELRDAGKIRLIGVSEVDEDELRKCRDVTDIATVQNRFNLADREHEAVLDLAVGEDIGFIPWFPLATGELAGDGSRLSEIAHDLDATPAQVALAWLLARADNVLPIPGTSSVNHLEDNVAAASLELTEDQILNLEKAVG